MKYKYTTLLAIISFLGVVYYLSFNYIYKENTKKLISQQIETSKNEAKLISKLLEQQLLDGKNKQKVKENFQKSIENAPIDNSFVCMFDDTGVEICHPNKEKIGKVLGENNSVIKSISNDEVINNFKESILQKREIGGLRKLKNYTEIVYLSPVKNSNWIVASHANVAKFKSIFSDLKQKLFFLFVIVWLISSLLIYFFLERINTNNLHALSKLNKKIAANHFNDIQAIQNNFTGVNIESQKPDTRFLTNHGTQLTPVHAKNIAYIYTENKISYFVEKNGKKSSLFISLDEIFKKLDDKLFYRASRKVILSANAIDKIEKYGNTQLRVYTIPESPIEIIISKAKLTDFKNWLGKN